VLGEICELLRKFCVTVNGTGILSGKLGSFFVLVTPALRHRQSVEAVKAQDLHTVLQKLRSLEFFLV
jgi:hypothetical protein